MDLFSPGDALATRDTESGLDWLDLTLTLGHSFDAVAGGYGGWAEGGWRPATVHEVCHLINDHAAAGLDPCPSLEVRILDPNPAIPALIDLLGATLSYETDLRLGAFEQAEAALGYFLVTDVEVGLGGVGNPALTYELFSHRNKMLALAGYGYGPPDAHDPDSGLFLVRAVPEPSTILLLGLGLAAIGAIGRRSGKAL